MRETLEAVAAGDLTPAQAEAQLRGYATTEAGRFDAAREHRRGIPEGILAEGKTPAEVAAMADAAVDSTGRALITRANDETAEQVRAYMDQEHSDATVERDARARTVVVHAADYEPPAVDAEVVVVSGGTADAPAAREAAVVAGEAGPRVETVEDVGVANLTRVLDEIETLRSADVLVVAAGREATLPTLVAGLVGAPVIGLPTSTGYGVGGDGKAALLGLLQSCTVLSVVNVDAGFVAGTQAGLIALGVDGSPDDPDR